MIPFTATRVDDEILQALKEVVVRKHGKLQGALLQEVNEGIAAQTARLLAAESGVKADE